MQPFYIKNHTKTLRALFKVLDTYMVLRLLFLLKTMLYKLILQCFTSKLVTSLVTRLIEMVTSLVVKIDITINNNRKHTL